MFSAILSSYDKITSAAEFGLVREILSVLTKLLSAFPQHMAQEVQVALQPAWTILVTSCQLYVTSCVNSIQDTHGLEGEEGGLTRSEDCTSYYSAVPKAVCSMSTAISVPVCAAPPRCPVLPV